MALKITLTSKEFTAREQWKLTRDAGILKMSDIEGQSIQPTEYCIYEDTNAEGEEQTLLSVLTDEGLVYATNSETFRREFIDMMDTFKNAGEVIPKITVMGGTTKSNRHYITCALAD